MTNQGGPEVLIAGFICADICVHTQMPCKNKKFLSKHLNGCPKTRIIASYLVY